MNIIIFVSDQVIILISNMKSFRAMSHRTNNQTNHIVQQNLNRQNLLARRYQKEADEFSNQAEFKNKYQLLKISASINKNLKKRSFSFARQQQILSQKNYVEPDVKDYSKLIIGLQYSLETERRKNQQLIQIIESQKSQLQNFKLLLQKSQNFRTDKASSHKWQSKISQLQKNLVIQKDYYENLVDSKNELLLSLESEIVILKKSIKSQLNKQDQPFVNRIFQLTQQIQELQHNLDQKHLTIQKMKLLQLSEVTLADEINRFKSAQNVHQFLQQIQMSNNMLMRKNAQIIKQTNHNIRLSKVLQAIQAYLDNNQTQVSKIQINILEHPIVNKLRILLREKTSFQKQLLYQLNNHSKQLNSINSENVRPKQAKEIKRLKQKIEQLNSDNRKLTSTVFILQDNIVNLQKKIQLLKAQNYNLEKHVNLGENQSTL